MTASGPNAGGPAAGPGRGQDTHAGRGRGRMEGFARGPGGNCTCPSCGKTVPHERGVPCTQRTCPGCATPMIRK